MSHTKIINHAQGFANNKRPRTDVQQSSRVSYKHHACHCANFIFFYFPGNYRNWVCISVQQSKRCVREREFSAQVGKAMTFPRSHARETTLITNGLLICDVSSRWPLCVHCQRSTEWAVCTGHNCSSRSASFNFHKPFPPRLHRELRPQSKHAWHLQLPENCRITNAIKKKKQWNRWKIVIQSTSAWSEELLKYYELHTLLLYLLTLR